MRKTPLKRKSWLKRGGPIKRRSPAEDGRPAPYHRLIKSKPFSQLKKRKRIPQKSAKRKVDEVEYGRLRKIFLSGRLFCERSGCRARATQVHHKAKRGRHYLNVPTWMACCAGCHSDIEQNRKWAESEGYTYTVAQIRALP